MSTQRITITMNTNRIERLSWIEHRKRHDGDYDLVGMGRTIETDSKTGIVVSDKTEPTGTTGWLPKEFIDPPKKSLWDVVYEALFSPTPPIKILHLRSRAIHGATDKSPRAAQKLPAIAFVLAAAFR